MDIHCHILPGVDDGAQTMAASMAMLQAAKKEGITSMIATPHLRALDPAHIARVAEAYGQVEEAAKAEGISLSLGYECNQRLFLDYTGAALAPYCLGESGGFLLEFSSRGLPLQWENYVRSIQRAGLTVVIAHPERYPEVQQGSGIARRMTEIGCELQVSADSLFAGLRAPVSRCAKGLIAAGLVSHIASDAHSAADYAAYGRAMKKYREALGETALRDLT